MTADFYIGNNSLTKDDKIKFVQNMRRKGVFLRLAPTKFKAARIMGTESWGRGI